VSQVETRSATYIHFMCDQHEVVLSNGTWTESFQPGEQVLDGMGAAQRDEIYDLFPELRAIEGLEAYQAARRSLKRHEAQLLVR
jgi:ABC-type branched-subunit amino acid transport system ATPase component